MSIVRYITTCDGEKYYDNGDPIGDSFYEKEASTDTLQGFSDMEKACALHNLKTKAVRNVADIDWFDVFHEDVRLDNGNGCALALVVEAFVNNIEDILLRPLVVDAIIARLEYELSTCVPYKVNLQPLKSYKEYLCKVQNMCIPTTSTSEPNGIAVSVPDKTAPPTPDEVATSEPNETARQQVKGKKYLHKALQLAIDNNLLTLDYLPTEKTLCKSTRAYLVHAIYEYYNRGKKSGEWGYVPTEWKLFDQLFGDKNLSNTYHNNKQRSTNTCNKKIIDEIFGIR